VSSHASSATNILKYVGKQRNATVVSRDEMTLVPTEASFYDDNCDFLPVSRLKSGAAAAEEGGAQPVVASQLQADI